MKAKLSFYKILLCNNILILVYVTFLAVYQMMLRVCQWGSIEPFELLLIHPCIVFQS